MLMHIAVSYRKSLFTQTLARLKLCILLFPTYILLLSAFYFLTCGMQPWILQHLKFADQSLCLWNRKLFSLFSWFCLKTVTKTCQWGVLDVLQDGLKCSTRTYEYSYFRPMDYLAQYYLYKYVRRRYNFWWDNRFQKPNICSVKYYS